MNSFRHSGASRIEVILEYAGHLHMLIRDDGCGMDTYLLQHGRKGHFGLMGMRERARRIGAAFEICSHCGGGTEVQLSLPGYIAYDGRARRFASLYRKAAPLEGVLQQLPAD